MKVGEHMVKRMLINLKRHLDLLYFFGRDKVISIMNKPPKVLSSEQTINKIIKDKCSVSRYGDGEFHGQSFSGYAGAVTALHEAAGRSNEDSAAE